MAAASAPHGAAPAELVVRGGLIRTFDAGDSTADSFAARGGSVVALGHRDVDPLIGPDTRVIELDGRTAMPGVNDAHLHGAWLGARWPRLFFGEHAHGHDPGGRLLHTEADRRAALERTFGLLAELGVTSYTEPGIGPGEDAGETGCFGSDMLRTYVDLHREGLQTARVTLLRLFGTIDGEATLADFERGIREPVPATDPRWLAIPGVKIFADGIPPMRTAWVREPYLDGSTGELLTRGGESPLDAFRRMVALADERGLQIAVHATGDRSIAEFAAVLEERGGMPAAAPHYVVHGDLVAADLLPRLRALGMGVSIQPLIAAHTHAWASAQLGAERTRRAWPLGALMDAGVLTTITSDAPIASPDWRRSLDAALALLAEGGRTDGASLRADLLRRITVEPARQDAADDWKGTLGLGMAADAVILDADPVTSDRPFAELGIETTIVDGRVVFER